jgi:hypothetical protein
MHHARELDLVPLWVMNLHTDEHSLFDNHRTFWYDVHRTIKPAGGQDMPVTQDIEATSAAREQDHPSDVRHPSPSRRAAAIEAAYILEAIRK